jgi:hypothetical protein
MKTIYDLELHEWVSVDELKVRRVPGGWMYDKTFVPFDDEFSKTFVPFDDEFSAWESYDPNHIIEEIEKYFHLPCPVKESGKIRRGNYPRAKQFIIKSLRKFTNLQHDAISELLGYKNPNSSIATLRNLEKEMKFSSKLKKEYYDLMAKIKRNGKLPKTH